MSNYKIHIDKPLPTPPQIDSHRDFDQLYGKYRSVKRFEFWRNLYRKPTYFAAVVALLGISYLVVESVGSSSETESFILPPLAELAPQPISVEVPATQADTLQLIDGSRLYIPEEAFEDETQGLVEGAVELRYRELADPFLMCLAGIPTRMDTTGKQQLVASSLIEIRAFQDGKLLKLRDGKALVVSYVGGGESPESHYALDSASAGWELQGLESVHVLTESPNQEIPPRPQRPALLAVTDTDADTLLTQKAFELPPSKPGRPFKVSIANLADFPNMRGYEHIYWEKLDDSHANDPNRESVKWGSATLRKGNGDRYQMIFTRRESGQTIRRTVWARPMFEAGTRDEAQRVYRERLDTYQQELAAYEARREVEAQRAKAAEADEARRLAAKLAYEQELREWEARYGSQDGIVRTYMREIQINHLGVHARGGVLTSEVLTPVKIHLPFDESKGEPNLSGSRMYATLVSGSLITVDLSDADASFPGAWNEVQAAWLITSDGQLVELNVSGEHTDSSVVHLQGTRMATPTSAAAFQKIWKMD